MATFLDAGLISHFNTLFVFIFVVFVMYGILSMTPLFKNAFINAVIATILGLLSATSGTVIAVFSYAAPWLVLLFIIIVVLQLIMMFLVPGAPTILSTNPSEEPTFIIILILLILIIFIFSIGQVSNESNQTTTSTTGQIAQQGTSFAGNVGQIIREPAVLGSLFVLLMAVFAVLLLARKD